MTRPETTTDERPSVPRKATLFCWECDHSNPIDGDWVHRTRDRRVEYVCPECETTLAKRPRGEERAAGRTRPRPSAPWERTVRTAVHVWRASVDLGLSSVAAMTPFGSVGTVR